MGSCLHAYCLIYHDLLRRCIGLLFENTDSSLALRTEQLEELGGVLGKDLRGILHRIGEGLASEALAERLTVRIATPRVDVDLRGSVRSALTLEVVGGSLHTLLTPRLIISPHMCSGSSSVPWAHRGTRPLNCLLRVSILILSPIGRGI